MMLCDEYSINKISQNDTVGVYNFMNSNASRFQRYFPKTLEQNKTLENSKNFTLKKQKQFDSKEEFLFIINESICKKVVGLVYIKELNWDKKQGEFAYCVDVEHEGKGVTTRAVEKLSNLVFDELELSLLQIIVHRHNIGSIKVAKKCNFTWQRTLLNEFAPPNELPLDMELYELRK